MAYDTVIQQGEFTSTGTDVFLPLRSDFDWVKVYNLTKIAASTQWDATTHYWHRGMAYGDSIIEFHGAATQVISQSTSLIGFNGTTFGGIVRIDSTEQTLGAEITITAGTNAASPVYDTANTAGINPGSIVRINSTAHDNINGMDFTVGAVTNNTDITLQGPLSQAPGVAAGAGNWRSVARNVTHYDMFQPRSRVICNITAANPAVVTTLVDHSYAIGDVIKLKVPASCGMVEFDGQTVTVAAITVSTFTTDVNSAAYTAFTYPLAAVGDESQYAQALPLGGAVTPLSNVGQIYLLLETGFTAGEISGSPAGDVNDAIKWIAGKSFAADVERQT